MKALLLTAPSQLELVDHPQPEPAPGEVLLRIRACGICGSDLHGWDGSSGRRQPPLIMGHEAAGEIVQLGAEVTGWTVGDRVTFDSMIHCGTCPACTRGATNLCATRRVVGVSPGSYRQHGAFAEYLALPANILFRLPDELSYAQAAFAEPTTIALHAVGRARLQPDSIAVVVGSGMIGLLVIQALCIAGVKHIIAVDRSGARLEIARQLGATDVLDTSEGAGADQLRALTGETGADVVFEVVGIDATVQLAITATRLGGQVVLVGNVAPEVRFPLQKVVTGEIDVLGSCGSTDEYPRALELIASGAIDVATLTSAVASLEDGAAWFARLTAPDGSQHLKVILQP